MYYNIGPSGKSNYGRLQTLRLGAARAGASTEIERFITPRRGRIVTASSPWGKGSRWRRSINMQGARTAVLKDQMRPRQVAQNAAELVRFEQLRPARERA